MLADKTFHYSYSQIDEHKPAEFCSLALKNSLRLDLGLGYFSSASCHMKSMEFLQMNMEIKSIFVVR